jgi:hypothetical protein
MKLNKIGNNILLAICDCNLIGKTLKENKIVFNIKESFYKGKKVDLEEAINLIKHSTIVNMIGQNIVNKAIQHGYVHAEAVINIKGVPHAQIVKI